MYPGDSNPLMLGDEEVDEDPPRQPLKARKDNTTGIIRYFFIYLRY